MFGKFRSATSAIILGVLLSGGVLVAQQPADVVLHNAKVLTVDSNFSIAQAIAIRGNQVAAVGQNQQILAMAGPGTKVFDLKGRTVIPGTINSHMHIFDTAEVEYGGMIGFEKLTSYPMDWSGVNTVQDVLNQVKGQMDRYRFKPGEWIYFASKGTGVTHEGEKLMLDGLTRWDLDKVSPDNPVVMGMFWPNVNGILVNSKAIDLMWAQHADFIKKYGRFWIDSAGRPDGHIEAPANRVFLSALPKPRPEDVGPVYKAYALERLAMGNTAISTRLPDYAIEAVKWMESRGDWPVRFGYGLENYFGNTTDLSKGLKDVGAQMGTGSDTFWVISSAPSAIDGSGSRSCSTQTRIAPVTELEKWWPNGQCLMDIEYRGAKGAPISANYVREWLEVGARDGVRLANTHAAADRTVKLALNLIEEMQQRLGPQAGRGWALDHCRMVDPADLPRAAKLGVMFSCSATLGTEGSEASAYGDKIAHTFPSPLKSMIQAGVVASLESASGNTWQSLETVITRKDRNGKVWGAHERLTREEALRMATKNAAIYILKGDKLGSLETGKLADLVVLDKDYLTMPEDDIGDMQPQLTMVDGKIVFAHTQFAREYNVSAGPTTVVSTMKDLQASRKPSGISRR